MRPMLIWSIGIFVRMMLMKLGICLSGCLGILMNLRLVVLILASPPRASLTMLLLCESIVIVLIMTVILVLIMFLLIVLLDLPV